MKNLSERGFFEEQLHGIFEDAEANPSNDLWTRIDADLANHQADQYRKRAFIYQWIAAASLVLAVGFAAASYFYTMDHTTKGVAGNENSKNIDSSIDRKPVNEGNKGLPEHSDGNDGWVPEINNTINKGEGFVAFTDDEGEEKLNSIKTENPGELKPDTDQEFTTMVEKYMLMASHDDLQMQKKQPINYLEGVHRPMYRHIDKRPTLKDLAIIPRQNKPSENFWAGVNFSSGLFDPGVSESSTAVSSAALTDGSFNRDATNVIPAGASYRTLSFESADYSSTNEEESISPGIAYTAGINTGFRLGKNWTIETGVAYVKNTNQSQTSTIIETREESVVPLTLANYSEQNYNLGRLKYSYEDIQLNNSFEFVSIPVKAAYWVLQSNLSLAISAGVSTNLFLQNNVADAEANLEDISVKPGEQSPYRNVYFNGILGTQITYQFPGAPYSLMLEPTYLLALNNMTKDDYYFNSRPRSFMIGVGLRYHFN